MRMRFGLPVVGLLLMAAAGCSALVQERAQTVVLVSDPRGAVIYVNGQRQPGITPSEVVLDPTRTHDLRFELNGCTSTRTLRPAMVMATYGTVKIPTTHLSDHVFVTFARGC
jgi:hypothetical protein